MTTGNAISNLLTKGDGTDERETREEISMGSGYAVPGVAVGDRTYRSCREGIRKNRIGIHFDYRGFDAVADYPCGSNQGTDLQVHLRAIH